MVRSARWKSLHRLHYGVNHYRCGGPNGRSWRQQVLVDENCNLNVRLFRWLKCGLAQFDSIGDGSRRSRLEWR